MRTLSKAPRQRVRGEPASTDGTASCRDRPSREPSRWPTVERCRGAPTRSPPRPRRRPADAAQSPAMGTLYLVRHGQASFGAADYDNLSELGHRQAVRLGEYWRERGMRFDAVITGTLKRHRQTWEGIAEGPGPRRATTCCPGPASTSTTARRSSRPIHPGKLPSPTRPSCTASISACCATASAPGCRAGPSRSACPTTSTSWPA